MKRCLVSGATGFIGSTLCDRLERAGIETVRLTRRATSPNAIVADLGREPIPSLEHASPEVVYHLASPSSRVQSDAEHLRVTAEGTRQLLAAAIGARVEWFVFFSTCQLMPVGIDHAIDETADLHAATPYTRAKLLAERLVLAQNGVGGLRTACLRLPPVYGAGHHGQLRRMIGAIRRGIFPPIPEFGGPRSFVHVDDVVDAALLVPTSQAASGRVYIVAEPQPYTSRQIYEIVLQALGRRPPRWQLPRAFLRAGARSGDLIELVTKRHAPFDSDMLERLSQPAYYSTALIERDLGFSAKRSFARCAADILSPTTS